MIKVPAAPTALALRRGFARSRRWFLLSCLSGFLLFVRQDRAIASHEINKTVPATAAVPPEGSMLFGVNFSPYLDGQDPNLRTPISEEQLRSRLSILVGKTRWVRTFSMIDGMQKAGAIAHSMGFKVALGAWLGVEATGFPGDSGLAINRENIDNLIAAGQRGEADILIVGSEVHLRNDLTVARLVEYINEVKAAVPGVPVASADIDTSLLNAPAVMAACDVIWANIYPYWEGTELTSAVFNERQRYHRLQTESGGKEVYISEAGWPSCGNTINLAVPNPENAASHFLNFETWVKAENVKSFVFEAFDESWKAAHEGPQGACWGIWDKTGVLKPGMQNFFDGATVPDNWSTLPAPGGPGVPSIQFLSVPAYFSFGNAQGRALHVDPSAHVAALFIRVFGSWWTKPYWTQRTLVIQPDGKWSGSVTTYGSDVSADKIRVYLFPASFPVPEVGGASGLPGQLDLNALAVDEIFRSTNPLAVSISSPAPDAIVSTPLTVVAKADSQAGATDVIFSVDGTVASTDSEEPYQFPWNPATVSIGAHTLSATVYEITGSSATAQITVHRQ